MGELLRYTTHVHRDTCPREAFAAKNQIRKVQRTDCSGGEESLFATPHREMLQGRVTTEMDDTGAGTAATEKSPAQLCASGDGSAVTMQQVLLERKTETGGSSARPIAICSHSAFV